MPTRLRHCTAGELRALRRSGKPIGSGSSADVFKCPAGGGKEVALKRVGDRASYKAEVAILATLQGHPNIACLIGHGQYDSQRYALLLEFYPNGTLGNAIRERRLTPSQALHILKGIASGLDYAHRLGIIHRDIKPGNILLSRDETPKICDWNLAVCAPRAPACGDPRFRDGNAWATWQTDIYCLGQVMKLIRRSCGGRLQASARYRALEARCRAANPQLRPCASAVGQELEAIARDVRGGAQRG